MRPSPWAPCGTDRDEGGRGSRAKGHRARPACPRFQVRARRPQYLSLKGSLVDGDVLLQGAAAAQLSPEPPLVSEGAPVLAAAAGFLEKHRRQDRAPAGRTGLQPRGGGGRNRGCPAGAGSRTGLYSSPCSFRAGGCLQPSEELGAGRRRSPGGLDRWPRSDRATRRAPTTTTQGGRRPERRCSNSESHPRARLPRRAAIRCALWPPPSSPTRFGPRGGEPVA